MVQLAARLTAVVPLVFAIVSVILSSLCLFSGHKEGFMEDYAIARLNTSGIGQDLIDLGGSDNNNNDNNDDGDGGFFDRVGDTVGDAVDDVRNKVEDTLNDITGSIADVLADELGISEWYSLHVMTGCEGMYKPNATAPGAGLNTTGCSDSKPNNRINLDEILDQELRAGPLEISLEDINWPEEIQNALDVINGLLLGLFILYVLTMAFTGLSVITSLASFIKPDSKFLTLINFVFASLGMLTSVIASIIVTVAVTKGINELNDVGEEVGVTGKRGSKFLALTWVVSGMMIGATVSWCAQFIIARRQRKMHRAPRKGSY